MTLPSSKVYFLVRNSIGTFWYGIYDYELSTYSWSNNSLVLSEITFSTPRIVEQENVTLVMLFENFPPLLVKPHPFDLVKTIEICCKIRI